MHAAERWGQGSRSGRRGSPEQVRARPILVAAPLLLEPLHCAGRTASGAGALHPLHWQGGAQGKQRWAWERCALLEHCW